MISFFFFSLSVSQAATAGAKAVQEKIAEVKGGAKTVLVIGATGAQGGSV